LNHQQDNPARPASAVNRAWRVFATGLSFAVMGLGGFLLGTVACAALWLAIRDRATRTRAVRRLVSRALGVFAGFMSLVGVMRWMVTGREHWHPGRPCLVVANHPSLIDVVFLLALFEGADCVVKRDVLRNPFWGLLTRAADYVPGTDPETLLAEAARRLAEGRTVILFPEGTRSVPGSPLAFGAAAGAIAVRAGCQCLPVVVTCRPPTLYKGLPWFRVPATRADFSLRITPAWPVTRRAGSLQEQRLAARDLTERLQAFFTDELRASDGTGPRPTVE
jgi:1-acyl-sn-glycerol-3-phosphate acyltransferase